MGPPVLRSLFGPATVEDSQPDDDSQEIPAQPVEEPVTPNAVNPAAGSSAPVGVSPVTRAEELKIFQPFLASYNDEKDEWKKRKILNEFIASAHKNHDNIDPYRELLKKEGIHDEHAETMFKVVSLIKNLVDPSNMESVKKKVEGVNEKYRSNLQSALDGNGRNIPETIEAIAKFMNAEDTEDVESSLTQLGERLRGLVDTINNNSDKIKYLEDEIEKHKTGGEHDDVLQLQKDVDDKKEANAKELTKRTDELEKEAQRIAAVLSLLTMTVQSSFEVATLGTEEHEEYLGHMRNVVDKIKKIREKAEAAIEKGRIPEPAAPLESVEEEEEVHESDEDEEMYPEGPADEEAPDEPDAEEDKKTPDEGGTSGETAPAVFGAGTTNLTLSGYLASLRKRYNGEVCIDENMNDLI